MGLKRREVWMLSILSSLITMTVSTTEASAKSYTRSCRANMEVSYQGQQIGSLNFTGKGTVGYFAPNKARKRAKKNIDECLSAQWNSGGTGTKPRQCTSSNKIYGYTISNMRTMLCDHFPNQNVLEDLLVKVRYSGDKGCNNGTIRTVVRNLDWPCVVVTSYEMETNYDRPGSDYRNFNTNSPGICAVTCDRESRCRAWTWVEPEHSGDLGKCYLKHSVPSRRRDNRCTSGVKR